MLSIVKSMSLIGLDGYLINVEVDVSPGMPCFEIVGLPDTSVKESKERIKTAIKNDGRELLWFLVQWFSCVYFCRWCLSCTVFFREYD